MKRMLLLLILGLMEQSLFGQINYRPTFIDQCTNKPYKKIMWWVSDSIRNYGNEYYGMDHAKLPRLGKYTLYCSWVSSTPLSITVESKETTKDTFYLRKLNSLVTIKFPGSEDDTSNTPPKYFICNVDSLANGKVVDYYYNGNKRVEGEFQNGKLIDTLHTYYRSGELYKVMIPDEEKHKVIIYSKDGEVMEK